jgi:hypothetical protein
MYTAWPVPTRAWESNTTMLRPGRAARLRESVMTASGVGG